ncbi:MAG: SprT family zinc-dependent metalloprotease [bacterium]
MEPIQYTLKTSTRSKRLRLAVHQDGKVFVTAPKKVDADLIQNFVTQKSKWILGKIDYFSNLKKSRGSNYVLIQDSRSNYLKQKENARVLAHKKVTEFNKVYNFSFKKISIKNQKTCWGSCSKRGNLNFNYKIALLPEKLTDYIIVHEICHLGEFNHSKKFWNLMARAMPDYAERRAELKKVGVVVE